MQRGGGGVLGNQKRRHPTLFRLPNPKRTFWICGWITGIDSDLVCVIPRVKTRAMEFHAFSPVYTNYLFALIAFVFKRLLLRIDHNTRGLEC